jgi:hypothetical protein
MRPNLKVEKGGTAIGEPLRSFDSGAPLTKRTFRAPLYRRTFEGMCRILWLLFKTYKFDSFLVSTLFIFQIDRLDVYSTSCLSSSQLTTVVKRLFSFAQQRHRS